MMISPEHSDRQKLILSLVLNFATRMPSAVGLIVILPLMRFRLGNGDYASLLSLMALGALLTFLFGGFNTVSRRLIGQAHGENNLSGEADAFVGIIVVNSVIAIFGVAACIIYARYCDAMLPGYIIPTFVIISAWLNTLDNVRAAYNEHYVTAILQIVFQVVLLTFAFTFPSTLSNMYLDAVYLSGYTAAASLVTAVLLLIKKPYLLRGSGAQISNIAKNGISLSLSDGLLMAALNLSVVYVGQAQSQNNAAWFSTLVRLFQTILSPILLLILPISSFTRLKWASWSPDRQNLVLIGSLAGGLVYGTVASVGLYVGSVIYIQEIMLIHIQLGLLSVFPIFCFFAALIAYKCYTTIVFAVSESTFIAKIVAASSVSVAVVGFIASRLIEPMSTVALCAGLLGGCLLLTIAPGAVKRFRSKTG